MSIFWLFGFSFTTFFDIIRDFSIDVSVLLINYSFIDLMTFINIDIIKIHILSIFLNFQFSLLYRYISIF